MIEHPKSKKGQSHQSFFLSDVIGRVCRAGLKWRKNMREVIQGEVGREFPRAVEDSAPAVEDWALYVIVRTDLDSMNPGKAQAHSGHAACAFVHKLSKMDLKDGSPEYHWLHKSTDQGFGTQINLKGAESHTRVLLHDPAFKHLIRGQVWDPTYPYLVTDEVRRLIDEKTHNTLIPRWSDSRQMWVMFRKEWTASYIFAHPEDPAFKRHMENFILHP